MKNFQLGSDDIRAQVFVIIVKAGFLFFLLPLHNIVKSYVAAAFGDKTALRHGYNSIPLNYHADRNGMIALLLFGYCWSRPIPTNFREHSKHPKLATIITALSGPLTYLILGAVTTFIYVAVVPKDLSYLFGIGSIQNIYGSVPAGDLATLPENLLSAIAPYTIHGFFYELSYILLTVTFVNLIPFRPFDGGEILELLIPSKTAIKLNRFLSKHEGAVSIITIFLIGFGVTFFISTPANYVFTQLSRLFLPIFT